RPGGLERGERRLGGRDAFFEMGRPGGRMVRGGRQAVALALGGGERVAQAITLGTQGFDARAEARDLGGTGVRGGGIAIALVAQRVRLLDERAGLLRRRTLPRAQGRERHVDAFRGDARRALLTDQALDLHVRAARFLL